MRVLKTLSFCILKLKLKLVYFTLELTDFTPSDMLQCDTAFKDPKKIDYGLLPLYNMGKEP